MRVIIDGTVGAGKTTLITGISQRNPDIERLIGLSDCGCTIYTDLVTSIIERMRCMGISDPSEDWNLFFRLAVDRCISDYHSTPDQVLGIYDRGIYFLELLAKKYHHTLPESYYDFCNNYRYDNPVFVFEPILALDMTKPHETDNKQKRYSTEDRIQQHNDILLLYKKWGYQTIEVPLVDSNLLQSHKYRLEFICKTLGIRSI